MAKNGNLNAAKAAKNDEFYTRLEDIENELQHYKDFFNGKTVYCNCDSPTESNFPRYFLEHFDELGLESITATCYVPGGRGWKGTKSKGGEYTVEQMDGDGDFRSEECIKLLDECDAVVTNPPFSLFREYVAQLMEYGKKFLILGNNNAITYKEIFPYIKDNKLWLGYAANKKMKFQLADQYQKWDRIDENGKKYGKVQAISWFTNIPHAPAGKPLILEKRYSPENYPKYDNYDAIEVSRVADIPVDYDGVIGVPITFLDKYNPDQFEIVGGYNYSRDYDGNTWNGKVNGKYVYKRLLIRRKDYLEPADFDIVGIDRYVEDNPNYGHRFNINGNEVYARILIRRKYTKKSEKLPVHLK